VGDLAGWRAFKTIAVNLDIIEMCQIFARQFRRIQRKDVFVIALFSSLGPIGRAGKNDLPIHHGAFVM